MAVDSQKMIDELELAAKHLDAAMAEFASIERMTNTDSYVMGHIRCCQAGTQSAIDFIHQCVAYKNAKASDRKTARRPVVPGPPQPPRIPNDHPVA